MNTRHRVRCIVMAIGYASVDMAKQAVQLVQTDCVYTKIYTSTASHGGSSFHDRQLVLYL